MKNSELNSKPAFFKVVVAFTNFMLPDREAFLLDQGSASLHRLAASF